MIKISGMISLIVGFLILILSLFYELFFSAIFYGIGFIVIGLVILFKNEDIIEKINYSKIKGGKK